MKIIRKETINNKNINTTRSNKKLYSFKSTGKNKIRKKKRTTTMQNIILQEPKIDNLLPINTLYTSKEEKIMEKKIADDNDLENECKPRNTIKKETKSLFEKLKCEYILKFIFEHLREKKNLKLIQHNKELQERLEISLNDYKKYKNRIEIVITPIPLQELKEGKNIFINIEEKKSFYHIYFNNSRNEAYRNYITKEDKVVKIRILLECGIKSLEGLFKDCKCIKAINFIKYKRSDITNMSQMFCGCTNLLFLDISKFITYRVTNMSQMFFDCRNLIDLDVINFKTFNVYDMSNMFYGCQSLSDLNLFNFDTSKVRNMYRMFFGCKLLKFLNISNFDTSFVNNMSHMFFGCQSLKWLNVSNFNTMNVTNMSYMFYGCQSLKELNVSNFKINFVRDLSGMFLWCRSLRNLNISKFVFHELANLNFMFFGCSKEFQNKMKEQNRVLYLNEKAFEGLDEC